MDEIENYLSKFRIDKQCTAEKNILLRNAVASWEKADPIFSPKSWMMFKIYACTLFAILFIALILIGTEKRKMQTYSASHCQKNSLQRAKIRTLLKNLDIPPKYCKIVMVIGANNSDIENGNNYLLKRKQILTLLQDGDNL